MEEKNKRHRRGRRKKKKNNLISNVILAVAVVVMCVSGFQLYKIYAEYNEGSSEYKKIIDIAVKENDEGGKAEFSVDFDALMGINSDVIGWIRFDKPEIISYPIVQGKDNEEYLTKTFEDNDNKSGTLFVDVSNDKEFNDLNTFIYGHNMKNKSMFAQLLEYKDKAFFTDNPFFYIYKPDGTVSAYKIFSVAVVKDDAPNYTYKYADDGAYMEYLDMLQSSSMHKTEVTMTAASQIVSLSTCTNVQDDDRFVVHGVKMSEE